MKLLQINRTFPENEEEDEGRGRGKEGENRQNTEKCTSFVSHTGHPLGRPICGSQPQVDTVSVKGGRSGWRSTVSVKHTQGFKDKVIPKKS